KIVEVEVLLILLGEVDVRIDQAGEEGGVAEVDDLRVRGDVDGRAGSNDTVALHHDRAVADDRVRGAIEEASGAKDDRFRRGRGRRLLCERLRRGEKKSGCNRFHARKRSTRLFTKTFVTNR